MIQVAIGCIVAAAFWLVMFSPWTAGAVNFWAVMSIAAVVLGAMSLLHTRGEWRTLLRFRPVHLVAGLAAAALLYGVFLVGHTVSSAMFDFATGQVHGIYALRGSLHPGIIAALLVLLIAPGEELFWRGFVQHRLTGRLGPWWGYLLAAALYALVHVWAMNFMLLVAALVCGLFWGAVKQSSKSLWPAIISHIVWDVAIFLVFPIG